MKRKELILLVVIFGISGCYSTNILYQSDKTKGVDFKKYKTYAWLATKDTAYTKLVSRQKVQRNLASAVIKQLTPRGMVLDTLNPDCLFTYTLVLNHSYDINQAPPEVYNTQVYAPVIPGQASVYYYIPGNVQPAYSGGLDVTTFRDGTLIIDMVDRKDNKVVWRASAQGKRDEREEKGVKATIDEIVPKMFKKFPVKQ
jgi:hypothetical protein